jgi:GNAT superfamily N-acetyltransferase
VAEVEGEIAGCGGWSRTSNLSASAQVQNKLIDEQLASTTDSAKIRAMFVHPNYARQGIGRRLMQMSELAAQRAGFKRLELIATLTGEPLYRRCGFARVETLDLLLPDGVSLRAVKMEKQL